MEIPGRGARGSAAAACQQGHETPHRRVIHHTEHDLAINVGEFLSKMIELAHMAFDRLTPSARLLIEVEPLRNRVPEIVVGTGELRVGPRRRF